MRKQLSARRLWTSIAVSVAILPFAGCQPSSTQPVSAAAESETGAPESASEEWEAFYLHGQKVGYGLSRSRKVDRAGEHLVEVESEHHLQMQSYSKPIRQTIESHTLETPGGKLLEFHTSASFGASPVTCNGHVDGDEMVIEVTADGTPHESRIPWSDDIRGFRGVEQSLAEKPLKPGEKRELRVLVPLVNQAADIVLVAGDHEETHVLEAPQRLLRIQGEARLPDGNAMTETIWTDSHGTVIKRQIEATGQESFRTTEAVAKADAPAADAESDENAERVGSRPGSTPR